jgi:hypothetical protein
MTSMERWDLVQSAGEPEDSSWIEDFADETLDDPEANVKFLDQVLPASRKATRDLRDSLRQLLPRRERAIVEISRAFGYLVSWPFSSPLQVGDIGVFDSKTSFTRLTSVSEIGMEIPRTEIVSEPVATDLHYTAGDVSIEETETGVRIEFGHTGGVFFLATGLSSQRVSDLAQFDQRVQALARSGKWQSEWNAVTETVKAEQAMFFIADEDGASVEVLGVTRSFHLASADKLPEAVGPHGMRSTVCVSPAVPFFRTTKINKSGRVKPVETFD